MYKICVQFPDKTELEYKTVLAPVIGDKLIVGLKSYTVYERWLFPDNENYLIVEVKP